MNKYQEALERLKEMAIRNVYGSYMGEYQEEFAEETQLFQELVDRATPKKVVVVTRLREFGYRCPVCNSGVGADYCKNCGQAIDWSDDK